MRGGCELRVDAGGRGAEGHQCLGELDNELLSSKDVKRPDRRLVRRLTREAELGRTDPFGADPRCCSSTLRGGVAPVIGTDERAGLPRG